MRKNSFLNWMCMNGEKRKKQTDKQRVREYNYI